MRATHEKKRGFSLIELLIVASLMAILAAFSIPQFRGFQKRSIAENSAADLESSIKLAQSMARSGVQNQMGAGKIDYYGFALQQLSGSPGCYGGYFIQPFDKNGNAVGSALGYTKVSCPVVLTSAQNEVDFQTITGLVTNIGADSADISVCYPGEGAIPVTIYKDGKVVKGEFDDSASCSCPCNP